MPSTHSRRSQSRPLGVTILCLVAGLSALRSLVGSLGLVGSVSPLAVLGLVGLGLAVGKLAILYGLWTLREWGYRWALALYGVSALLALVTFSVFGLLLDVAVVAYLVSRAEHFG